MLSFLLLPLLASAANVTIDDSSGQWSYSPSIGAWGVTGPGYNCSICLSQPDPKLAYDGTWHDSTSDSSAVLTFTGSAVYVYTICPGPHPGGNYVGTFSFKLDNADDGNFNAPASGCPQYEYNYLVYNRTGLPFGSHTVEVINKVDGRLPLDTSNLLLDYAIIDDEPASGDVAASPPVAVIVVPIIVLLLLCLAAVLYVRKRHVVMRRGDEILPRPYTHQLDPYSILSTGATVLPMSSRWSGTASADILSCPPSRPPPAHMASLVTSENPFSDSSGAYPHGDDLQLEAAMAVIASRVNAASQPIPRATLSPSIAPIVYEKDRAVHRTDAAMRSGDASSPDGSGSSPPSYADTLHHR